MLFEPVTTLDLDTVAEQLGRHPKDVVGIAARCPQGHPAVVANYPIQRRGERIIPFPTLYWLTCPTISKSLARLEMRGMIDRLDERLVADDEFAARLDLDHEAYLTERWELLSDDDRAAVERAGLSDALRTGIGGQRNRRATKCLHLHFAHHLASANTIGAWLAAEHGIGPCGQADFGS